MMNPFPVLQDLPGHGRGQVEHVLSLAPSEAGRGLMPDDAGIRQPGFKAHSRPLAELDVLVNF